MLNKERRRILNRLSDGALHDLFAWPLIDEAQPMGKRLKISFAMGMLRALGHVDVVEETDDHMWAQITEKGRQAMRQRDKD